MALARSKKSALVMAAIWEASAGVTTAATVALRYLIAPSSLETGQNLAGGSSLSGIAVVAASLGALLVLGLGLAMLALLIYGRDDSHFGPGGAIRWALSGATWAIFVQAAFLLLPDPGSAASAFAAALYQVLRIVAALVLFELAYRLVFGQFPLPASQRRPQPGASGRGQAASLRSRARTLPSSGELLARIRQKPEIRAGFQAMAWFLIAGGLLVLVVGLATPQHPNLYLLPSLVVMGVEGMVTGAGILMFLRRSRLLPWFALLSCTLLILFLYFLVRVLI